MSKTIEIFEQGMCCPTGLCGPSINQDLLRMTTVINTLEKKGITIKRYNLTRNANEFIANKTINELLSKDGEKVLPITIVDGKIEKKGSYPSNDEFTKWTGFSIEPTIKKVNSCGCGGGKCR